MTANASTPRKDRRRRYRWAAAAVLLLGSFAAAMVFGAADTTLRDVWRALATRDTGETLTLIREIRLPREVAAVLVGSALAVSGAVMQGMTRNPLADPGLLGLTAGANAALAATIAFLPSASYFAMIIACFLGAVVGSGLVFGLGAMRKGGLSPLRLVLAGAAVSAFLYAISEGIGLAYKISKDVSMWTAGGLVGTSWEQIRLITPFVLVGIVLALLLSRQITILSLSEEAAVGLGQRTAQLKAMLFGLTIVLTGASVALVGNLTFVGLLIPHIARGIVGTDYRSVIPFSAIAGGAFMMLADTLSRTINAPYETPVAAIVSMVGLPFFLFVVHKGGKAFS